MKKVLIYIYIFLIKFWTSESRYLQGNYVNYDAFKIVTYSDITDSVTENNQEVEHAVCKIVTKEIEATANATVTRQLKGVCTTSKL